MKIDVQPWHLCCMFVLQTFYLKASASLSRESVKIINESSWKLASKQSHSWFLASNLSTWPGCCASVLSVDAHMHYDVRQINVDSKQREKTPFMTRTPQWKHELAAAHIHNFFRGWSVTCRCISKARSLGIINQRQVFKSPPLINNFRWALHRNCWCAKFKWAPGL